jgi:anti-sigma factor RsiW
MNSRISPRELEQLSAYLDGGLPPRATAQLEARLKAEPQLAAALKQLELTRAMLRRAPQRKIPHSFVLTRSMVLARAPGWNSFNFASATASLLLFLTQLGDFSVNGLPALASARQAEPMALMAEAPAADSAEGAAGTFLPTMEPVPSAEEAAGELYAETDLQEPNMKSSSPLTALIVTYSRELEAGLASVALLAGLAAAHLRRRPR